MAATSSYTPNQYGGIGFSGNELDIKNEVFVDYVKGLRKSKDPNIRREFFCDIIEDCGAHTFLEEYIGRDESYYKSWQVKRQYNFTDVLTLSNAAVINIAANGTAVLPLTANAWQQAATGGNILPQKGEFVLLPPGDILGKITAVSVTVGTPTITVQNQSATTAIVIPANSSIIVVGLKELANCDCPDGRIRLNGEPLLEDISMRRFGDAFDLCGANLMEMEYRAFPHKVMDDKGNVVVHNSIVHEGLFNLYRNMERSKNHLINFLPNGTWDNLKKRAMKWVWADPNVLADADVQDLITLINAKGFKQREYCFIVGQNKYNAAQNYINSKAIGKVTYGCFDAEDACKNLNLTFCSIEQYGLKLLFILDTCMSSGNGLGANGFDWTNRGYAVPMGNRKSMNVSNRRDYSMKPETSKYFTVVYFKDMVTGTVYDSHVDSTGVHGERKIQGAGCRDTKYSIETEFAVEAHCIEEWVVLLNS